MAASDSRPSLRLLLVEDDEADEALLRSGLDQLETTVAVATVGEAEQALAFLRRRPPYETAFFPDAIVLELKLPHTPGLELLAEIKSDPQLRVIPVLVLTSSRYPPDLTRAYELQAAACFVKPLKDYRLLLERIVGFLSAATPPPPRHPELGDGSGEALSEPQTSGTPRSQALWRSAPEALSGLDVDVAEREPAEERFRLAVESSPSGIITIGEDGLIELANAETHRMFGYPAGELEGQSVDVLVPDALRAPHALHRHGFVARPEARAMGSGRDLYGQRKDGSLFPVEIGLNPIRSDAGLVVLSTIVDITERKQAEAALTHQANELARSNEDLVQFAYVASHDLQEPLRIVSGYTRLLGERYGELLDEEGRSFIRLAQNGSERMAQLLHDLLAYSRVTTRGEAPSPVSLNACVEAALANLTLAVEDAGAELRVGDDLPEVLADMGQLTLVLQNLIGNALKFRRDDPVLVEVSAERRASQVTVFVTDNGIGVPAQHGERIFEVFERLHPQHVYPGTGIGLALCKRVIERHRGQIWVVSDGETGSSFVFTLPAVLR